MKLNELAVTRPTQQIAKVFESHFDQRIPFDSMNRNQLHSMYRKVRGTLNEVRATSARHNSEKNPAYLKLMMMEQALAEKIYEDEMTATPGAAVGVNPQQAAAMAVKQKMDQKKQLETDLEAAKKQVVDLQNQLNSVNTSTTVQEWRRRARANGYYLSEGEVQQAQVVLAAQDMVDKMQSMIEDSTEMQFKELPALVDSIKNQIGTDQAAQFNNDAQAALSGLVQNLQSSKQQLEQALGVVTGQGPVPGADAGMTPPGGDMGLAGPPPGEEEVEVAAELPVPEEPGAIAPAAALGRGRR
jgi:hypothetical protein